MLTAAENGGAATFIFRVSPSQPTIWSRDDPGTTFTAKRADGFGIAVMVALIRPPLDSRARLPVFSVLRPLPSGAMIRPPDKEDAWTLSNGIAGIVAGSPA